MSLPNLPNFFTRLSENHAKKLRSLKQKKFRDLENACLAEGLRLCEEILAAGASIREVIVTESLSTQPRVAELLHTIREIGIPVFLATPRQFNVLSDEKSPQGIACVVKKPDPGSINKINSRLVVVCDNLQDPGNLGALLRSSEWFGVNDILLSCGCVDPYNAKVVRGSMGAIFRLNVFERTNLVVVLPELKKRGYRILGATMDASFILADVQSTGKDIVLIGNEASGLTPELFPHLDMTVAIPGQGRVESLNAAIAASIFLYHFSQH